MRHLIDFIKILGLLIAFVCVALIAALTMPIWWWWRARLQDTAASLCRRSVDAYMGE